MEQKTRLIGGFQLGFTGGLGVLLAIVIGQATSQIINIIGYVVMAFFVALAMQPAVNKLVSFKIPKPLSILLVTVSFFGLLTLLISQVIPGVVDESVALAQRIPELAANLNTLETFYLWDSSLNGALSTALENGINFLANFENWTELLGGIFQVGLGIVNAITGIILVSILALYFVSSLDSIKQYLGKLVAASKRENFNRIVNQISTSIGRWVIGQFTIAAIHALVVFIFLTIIGSEFSLLLTLIAFFFALIPLIGPVIAFTLITSFSLLGGLESGITVGIFYLIYLQIDAYLISPRVMRKAVQIPSAAVVIAAVVGGTLMGVLGALIAIPVAASILLIIREVWMPHQQLR